MTHLRWTGHQLQENRHDQAGGGARLRSCLHELPFRLPGAFWTFVRDEAGRCGSGCLIHMQPQLQTEHEVATKSRPKMTLYTWCALRILARRNGFSTML